jgi:DNA-directed RNA polymerase subunit RPC12/RpoP
MSKCTWYFYDEDEYYETECGASIEKEDKDNICPTYCPYCGDKIKIE